MPSAVRSWASAAGLAAALLVPILVAAAAAEGFPLNDGGETPTSVSYAYRSGRIFWPLYGAWWLCSVHLAPIGPRVAVRRLSVLATLLFCLLVQGLTYWVMRPGTGADPLEAVVYIMGAAIVVAALPGVLWLIRRRVRDKG